MHIKRSVHLTSDDSRSAPKARLAMKPDLSEILASLRVLRLPMRTLFRGIESREVALFEGPYGWGEFSPFLEYGAIESSRWLQAGIEAAFHPPVPTLRKMVSINATLPAVDDPSEIARILSWYPGARRVKIKVTEDHARNIARIEEVRRLFPSILIRLDLNGAMGVDEAVTFLEPLAGGIEYVEQPCETIEELRELKSRIDIKVAADEVIRKSKEPLSIDLSGAADLIVLKSSPLGGIKAAMAIADHFALPVVVSSALESAVGISQGLHLAASLKQEPTASGLATGVLFTHDVARHEIEDGAIEVKNLSSIDRSALDSLAVESERFSWWQDRFRESYEVLFS